MLRKKLIGVIGAAALATMLVAGPATAAPGDLTINGGSVAFDPQLPPTISTFNTITLNGAPQLTSLTIDPFNVINSEGTGAGWNVLLTVPDLVYTHAAPDNVGGVLVDGDFTIPANTFLMQAPTITAVGTSDATGVAAHAVLAGSSIGTGFKMADAAAPGVGNPGGMGEFLVSPQPVKVVVPVDARAGLYQSAATIAVTSGP
jgi:hypothetical protein